MKLRSFPAGLLALLLAGSVVSEDLQTLSGRTFRDASYSAPDEDSVRVKHRGGEERVYFYDLPEAVRAQFGFDTLAALRRKTEEVERLKAELETARSSVANAAQNSSASSAAVSAPAAATIPAAKNPTLWEKLPPTRPATELPKLEGGELVTVFDLVNHYRADVTAADGRYRKKTFKLEGVIERIEEEFFGRAVKVLLESPDRTVRVVCAVEPPTRFKSTYTLAEGTVLMANDGRGAFTWLRAGERLVVSGSCAGLKDGAIFLNRAELVR